MWPNVAERNGKNKSDGQQPTETSLGLPFPKDWRLDNGWSSSILRRHLNYPNDDLVLDGRVPRFSNAAANTPATYKHAQLRTQRSAMTNAFDVFGKLIHSIRSILNSSQR